MQRKKIIDHVVDVMMENNVDEISFADMDLIQEIARRAKIKNWNPEKRRKSVISALERSDFTKGFEMYEDQLIQTYLLTGRFTGEQGVESTATSIQGTESALHGVPEKHVATSA